jgi:hypothetical protein
VFELGAGGDAESFGASIASVAAMGTGGCGFEQQLEAVSPSAPTVHTVPGSVPPVFALGTLSHGDRQNAGFVRPGSALAIVLLTDEEDCSARDPGIFDQAARRTAAPTSASRASPTPRPSTRSSGTYAATIPRAAVVSSACAPARAW